MLKTLPIRDHANEGGELDQLRLREAARAVIEGMRELPSDPGPRYTAGEYSRRTQEAMVDDALNPAPDNRSPDAGTESHASRAARL